MKGKTEKLHGAAKYTHQIYTIEGGPEKHDDNEQTKGILKLAALLLISNGIKYFFDKIGHLPIKALEEKNEDKSC